LRYAIYLVHLDSSSRMALVRPCVLKDALKKRTSEDWGELEVF